MATNIITIAWVVLLIWLVVECRHIHQLNKKADKLIEEIEKEINSILESEE